VLFPRRQSEENLNEPITDPLPNAWLMLQNVQEAAIVRRIEGPA
jgi:hypothetical protein